MTTHPVSISGDRDEPVSGRRVGLVGAVHEALPMLHALLADQRVDVVVLVTDSATRDGRISGFVDLASVGRAHGVPVLDGVDLRSPEAAHTLSHFRLDLLVVVGWTRLVPARVLALPRYGCVGFHASLLPKHRGRAPVNWAIIRGETRTGATMLMLDPGVDTGPIVDQRPIPIGPDDTCGTVYERVAQAGVEMLQQHLPALLAGTAPRRRQLPHDGDLLPRRTPEMGITDWARSAADVHNWIRALSHPYPGAFSRLEGEVVRLWRAGPGPAPSDAVLLPAGMFVDCVGDGVLVAARGGTVRLLSVEADRGEVAAAQWFRSRGLSAGMGFDPVDPVTSRWALGLCAAPESVPAAGSTLAAAP